MPPSIPTQQVPVVRRAAREWVALLEPVLLPVLAGLREPEAPQEVRPRARAVVRVRAEQPEQPARPRWEPGAP